MVSSGVLYIIGDHVAQLGIEDRKWFGSWRSMWSDGLDREEGDDEELFDWARLVRMSVCKCIHSLHATAGAVLYIPNR